MTTIMAAPAVNRGGGFRAAGCSGFTILELLVAATISGFVLTAVLTAFVFFSKNGVRMASYTDMERDARRTLSRFAQDVRQADTATWVSTSSLRLTVNGADVTYTYSSSDKTFSRTESGATQVLATRVSSFQFTAYNLAMTAIDVDADLTSAGASTKMVQVDIDLSRSSSSVGAATNQILSARYVLRNKKVS